MHKSAKKHPFFHTFIKVWIWPRPPPHVEKIHTFYLFFLKASLSHKETKGADNVKSKWAKQEEALEGVETVGESGRIFVRNILTICSIRNFYQINGNILLSTVDVWMIGR